MPNHNLPGGEGRRAHDAELPLWLFDQAATDLHALVDALRRLSADDLHGNDHRHPEPIVRSIAAMVGRLQLDLRYAAEFLSGTVQYRERRHG